MSHRKLGFETIGLCLIAALGLMAFIAAPAQAKGHWFVLKEKVEVLLKETMEFTATKDVMPTLLFIALGVEVLCQQFTVEDGLLFPEGGSLAVIFFNECDVLTTVGLKAVPCTVDPVTAKIKDLLILHEKKTYDLIEADKPGEPIAVIKFLGKECALPAEVKITGSLVIQDCNASNHDLAIHAIEHLVEEAPEKLFPSDGLFFGEQALRLDGSAWVSLIGKHKGLLWGGLGL